MILPAGYSDDARALWDVATALNRAAGAVSLPPLLFFTDPERTPRPWETAARLPAGAGVVFRGFGRSDALETGRRLREATTRAGVKLLVGLDPGLVEAVAAEGLHLPEHATAQAAAIRADHPDWLLTAAWHGGPRPAAAAVDALVLSPAFPAGGTSAGKPALGLDGFRARAGEAGPPVYALGGIGPHNARALTGSGACGLAGVDAVQAAFGPAPRT